MKLQQYLELLSAKQIFGTVPDVDVKGIAYDPLRIEPGFIFVAINIYTQLDKIEIPDGHVKIADAIKKGAIAIIYQNDIAVTSVVRVKVPDSRFALAVLADAFYEQPSRKLKLLALTGTNGKTTTTHIVESILIQHYKIGLIGTLYYKLQGVIHLSKDTTPEPPDLQSILKKMADRGFDFCVLEASSHGIELHRLAGCQFQAAAFTNLTQDHLDFHKTMEAYRKTKLRLFEWLAPDTHAVINIDDPSGKYFIAATSAKVLTYGLLQPADLTAKDIKYGIQGTEYTLVTPIGEVSVRTGLIGKFNLYNALAAVGVALSQGATLEEIKSGLERKIVVAGRFEQVNKGQKFSVVVDYAHTPDGLENVLSLARGLKPKQLITVFGCGGDRDKEKRPMMGQIADQYSDQIIVTADNPRNEDPVQISKEIVAGIQNKPVQVILDRREAIAKALEMASEGDIVMLCGKGHETTQTIKNDTFHFNDREVAEELLDAIR